jgi:hypothetical protein
VRLRRRLAQEAPGRPVADRALEGEHVGLGAVREGDGFGLGTSPFPLAVGRVPFAHRSKVRARRAPVNRGAAYVGKPG